MKKAAVIAGSFIIALVLGTFGWMYYAQNHRTRAADKTGSDSVNVMLTRPDNWKRIISSPVTAEDDIYMVDGSTATIPITAELLRQFYGYTDEQVNMSQVVWHSTTHNAYVKLIDREYRYDDNGKTHTVGLILVTPPSDEEKAYAKEKGVALDSTPVAKDGFVFIANKNNPVDSLTVEQIQGIYSGEIENWKELGGEDRKIKAYQREANSGSQTAMEQMVMKGRQMKEPIETEIFVAMGGLVDAVAEYDNGPASIGYTYYYYINNLYKSDDIKVIKVNATAPTNDNLISGAYPFTASYYAVMRADEPKDSPARLLRDFLLTEKGQELVAIAGYCKAVN